MLRLAQTCSNWSKLVYFRIQEIEEEAFKDLTDLKGLDLSLNIISTVGDTLEPLTNLMKLNLSDNYITSLPRKAFHALEKLSTLDVSNNTIVEIGMNFENFPTCHYSRFEVRLFIIRQNMNFGF